MDAQFLGSLSVFLQIIDEEGFIEIDVRLPDYLLIDVGIRNTVLFPASARSVTWNRRWRHRHCRGYGREETLFLCRLRFPDHDR